MPLTAGQTTLAAIRTSAQQRADMVNSGYVTTSEWDGYINASYQELYGLLITSYGEDYEYATPYTFQSDGVAEQFPLPADFFKALGVDWVQSPGSSLANTTLKRFNFGERNRFTAPFFASVTGLIAPMYRLAGNTIWFKPKPSGGQTFTLYYAPRLPVLVNDSDVVDGVNGWEEYIITDAAIKALQKEESDVSVLTGQKQALIRRINDEAANRDVGSPSTVTDVYGGNNGWGY
jgi:hypothetical protein